MSAETRYTINKIAEVTILFWILKIIATTLGETLGDFIAQTLNLGYVIGLGATGVLLIGLLIAQIRAKHYHPALFWAAIVATTTAGTEISDLMDRTLGLGYLWGSVILTVGLLATLMYWYRREGHLSVDPIVKRDTEIKFWVAVVFSNSLGTAFGDMLVDVVGLSFWQGAIVCAGVIAAVLALHYTKTVNDIVLFWLAFIFTRPFGATFGDLLTKPTDHGGLDLGTYNAAGISVVLMAVLIWVSMRLRRARGID